MGSSGQDLLHMMNGEVWKVRILEVGKDEVRFKKMDDASTPEALGRDKIRYIIYANGTKESLETGFQKMSDVNLENVKKHLVALDFSNVVYGRITGYYEKLNPSRNVAFKFPLSGEFLSHEDAGMSGGMVIKFIVSGKDFLQFYMGPGIFVGKKFNASSINVREEPADGTLSYNILTEKKNVIYNDYYIELGLNLLPSSSFNLTFDLAAGPRFERNQYMYDRYRHTSFNMVEMFSVEKDLSVSRSEVVLRGKIGVSIGYRF
jgi:hypothetical protein